MHTRAVMSQLWPQFRMDGPQLDEIIDHIVRFTMAGLDAVKSVSERKKKFTPYERPANYRQSSEARRKSADNA
jgi:hypothetical protein